MLLWSVEGRVRFYLLGGISRYVFFKGRGSKVQHLGVPSHMNKNIQEKKSLNISIHSLGCKKIIPCMLWIWKNDMSPKTKSLIQPLQTNTFVQASFQQWSVNFTNLDWLEILISWCRQLLGVVEVVCDTDITQKELSICLWIIWPLPEARGEKKTWEKNSPNSLSDLALQFSPSAFNWLNPNRREKDKESHGSQPPGHKKQWKVKR